MPKSLVNDREDLSSDLSEEPSAYYSANIYSSSVIIASMVSGC